MDQVTSPGRSVALLRGINVGRTTKVPMAMLRELFAEAGATGVSTVLNSGNVIFDGTVDAPALEKRIAAETGVSTRLLIIEPARLRRIVEAFPFAGDESRLTITFLSTVPADVVVPPALGAELVVIGSEAVYQSLPDGIANSRMTPSFWRQFGPDATARNLRTATRLLALVEAGSS